MMGFRHHSRYLLHIFLSLSSIHFIDAVDEACRADDNNLLSNNKLQNSFINMLQQFNRTCETGVTCDVAIDPIELYLIHDYSNLGSRFMKNACERRRNYKMCRVTTKTRFSEIPGIPDLGDQVDIGFFIVEKQKPVCFPPQCKDSEAYIVDPNPARCRPGGGLGCEVISYDVDCPQRTLTNGKCKNNLLAVTSVFYVQRTIYEGIILADCANTAQGNPNNYCKLGYGELSGGVNAIMNGAFMYDSYYQNHDKKCKDAGGVICTADVEGSLTVPENEMKEIVDEALEANDLSLTIDKYSAVIFNGDVKGLPQCIAPSCDLENDVPTLYIDHFESILQDQNAPFKCNEGSETCEVNISNIICKVPTNAPSESLVPTDNPSTKPTVSLTSGPSTISTGVPTDKPSLSPSHIPTSSPTAFPTISPTAFPTSSAKPTGSLTSGPSTIPTGVSTDKPSVSPSRIPTSSPTVFPTDDPSLMPTETPSSAPWWF